MKISKSGFTIVELLIVIVVIGILAAITIIAYNSMQQRALTATLSSDLTGAAKQMGLVYASTGAYPSSFPSAVKASQNVSLSLSQATGGFCINGEVTTNSSIQWYYDSTTGSPAQGACSGAVIPGSELGTNPNLVTNTDFSSGWGISAQDPTGRSISTRAGTAGDPYPTRPVLILNNVSTNPTTWAYLRSSAVTHASIISGRTYLRAYYVRKTGTGYNTSTPLFGVLDGNGLNASLSIGASTTASTTWQRLSGTTVALQNAPVSNVLYIGLPTAPFTATGWTLEFQGFEIREQ